MTWVEPTDITTEQDASSDQFNEEVLDNLRFLRKYGGGGVGWTSYTPTLTQSGAVTKTVKYARWCRVGRLIHVQFSLNVTGSGTANNAVQFGLPVAGINTGGTPGQWGVGTAGIYDASAGFEYPCRAIYYDAGSQIVKFRRSDTTGLLEWGQDPNVALASGDGISGDITYEAGSD